MNRQQWGDGVNKIIAAVLAVCVILLSGCGGKEASTGPAETGKVDPAKNIIVDEKGSSILGYIISHMDGYDKEQLSAALASAKPDIPYEWENEKAGTSYRFILFSEEMGKKKGCKTAEIYSGNKRLKACVEMRFDPEKGWIIKSQQ